MKLLERVWPMGSTDKKKRLAWLTRMTRVSLELVKFEFRTMTGNCFHLYSLCCMFYLAALSLSPEGLLVPLMLS